MTLLQSLSFIIGLYLMLEAISASAEMNAGDSIFRMIKYLLVGYVGASLIFYVQSWDKLTYGFVIAVFLFPKFENRLTYWRNKQSEYYADRHKRRANDK
jgi:hypothetical protein